MPIEQATLLAALPLQVILLLGLAKVYTDNRADRTALLKELTEARQVNDALQLRVGYIEGKLGIGANAEHPQRE